MKNTNAVWLTYTDVSDNLSKHPQSVPSRISRIYSRCRPYTSSGLRYISRPRNYTWSSARTHLYMGSYYRHSSSPRRTALRCAGYSPKEELCSTECGSFWEHGYVQKCYTVMSSQIKNTKIKIIQRISQPSSPSLRTLIESVQSHKWYQIKINTDYCLFLLSIPFKRSRFLDKMWDIVPTYKIYSFPKYPSKVKVDKNKCRIPLCWVLFELCFF